MVIDLYNNPIYYQKNLNVASVNNVIIDSNSNLLIFNQILYDYISDFNSFMNIIVNYDTKSNDRLIKNFGQINKSVIYNFTEKQNFYYLENTLRNFLQAYWNLINYDNIINQDTSRAWLLPNIMLSVYIVLYLSISALILYFSYKIKLRKTIYINYFTKIEENEMIDLKDNCVKFYKYLNGEIIFNNDFIKKKYSNHQKENLLLNENNEKNDKIDNNQISSKIIMEYDNTHNKKDDSCVRIKEMGENSSKNIELQRSVVVTNHEIVQYSSLKNLPISKSKINESSNEKIQFSDKKKKIDLNKKDLNQKKEEVKKSDVEKTPSEIILENKKKWILESSKKDKNKIYYFLCSGIILFVLFDYFLYSCRSNQILSFNIIKQISRDNFQRDVDILNFLNYGREIVSFNLGNNDFFETNFLILCKKLANITRDEFGLTSYDNESLSFLNDIMNNDKNSMNKNNFCSVMNNLVSSGLNNFLTSDFNFAECNSLNSGVLGNGILYFIHDLKSKYSLMNENYMTNIKNYTYLKTILQNENYCSYSFIYLKYLALFFDYFNTNIINSFSNYLTYLSKISIIMIVFFLFLLLIKIWFIVKSFNSDIKNARGIICVIPSEYLKDTQTLKENTK